MTSVEWNKKAGKQKDAESGHGTYILQTSLDENDEENIWEFYNVIRTYNAIFCYFAFCKAKHLKED